MFARVVYRGRISYNAQENVCPTFGATLIGESREAARADIGKSIVTPRINILMISC